MNRQKAFTPLETMAVKIPVRDNKNFLTGFTLVELLTSIVIIVILIGLLLPSLARIRRSAKEAAQKVQFATIDTALEAFKQDYGDYPPSTWQDVQHYSLDPTIVYSGSEKLAEALIGRDLRGFNPHTIWCQIGLDRNNEPVYTAADANLRDRTGPYLDVAKTNAFRIRDIYTANLSFLTQFNINNYVICDVFSVKKVNDPNRPGIKAGTPILYYKANTNSKSLFCSNRIDDSESSIYNHFDNYYFLNSIRILPDCTQFHHLVNNPPGTGLYFCRPEYRIDDTRIQPWSVTIQIRAYTAYWPNSPDSYILISAGADHDFGTKDDIFNF